MGSLISLLFSPSPFRRLPLDVQQMIWNAVQADDEATARRLITTLIERRNTLLQDIRNDVAMANPLLWLPPELTDLQLRLTAGRWNRLRNDVDRSIRAERGNRGAPFPYLGILRSVMWNHPTRANNHIQRHTHLHIDDFVEMAEDVGLEEGDLRLELAPIVQRHVSPLPRRRADD